MYIANTEPSIRYRPLAQIARGRISEIVLAEMDLGQGAASWAVLKRLSSEVAGDSQLARALLREAQVCSRIGHPNVVRVYEVLDDATGPVVAMEYLDGQSLARILNRLNDTDTLGLALHLRILIEVLKGLDHAHDLPGDEGGPAGVVHGDVNPHNVFVTYDGQIKLMGFGVSRELAEGQRRLARHRGPLGYLAPEQILGHPIDGRADVFAVGVMLWETVTGG